MQVKSSFVPIRSVPWAVPPLGTITAPLMQLILFSHHFYNCESVSPIHSSPAGFRPDPARSDSQSQRKYRFTTEKNNFCGSDATATSSFAKNFSSYTGNEAPFKAPEWGYIYTASPKRYLKKHIDTSKNRKK